jgi:hypothetical protein
MNQEIAQLALKFLERITLQPAEIDAFTTVYKALQEYKDPAPEVGLIPPSKKGN